MKIKNKLISLGLLLVSGILVGITQVTASAKVRLGSFLITKKTLKVKTSSQSVIIKIPKGTNIQVDGFKVKNGSKYAYFNIEKLSYDIRKPLIGKNTSVISAWQRLTRSNFKQIKKPTYLNYYSAIKSSRKLYNKVIQHSGSLWEGTRFPANYKSVRNDRIRITNDGYLEYFENFPYAYRVSGKPAYTEKVIDAKHEVAREYLTVKNGFSKLPFDKLANGDHQLVIWWTAADTYTALPNENNASQVISTNLYRLGHSKTNYWFMKSGTATL